MKQIDDTINNLEQIKDKSSLKVFLEEYKKMYEQLSEERDYRIRLIEELENKLLEIRKHNKEIEGTTAYQELKRNYMKDISDARKLIDLSLLERMKTNMKNAHKQYDEKVALIENNFKEELEKIDYITDYIVEGYHGVIGVHNHGNKLNDFGIETDNIKFKVEKFEYDEYIGDCCITNKRIDKYIKGLYRDYVCEVFGHEYLRNKDGDKIIVAVGARGISYEYDVFERPTGRILDLGSSGTPTVKCKYCGQQLWVKGELISDFKDKQKILLPLSKLNEECK